MVGWYQIPGSGLITSLVHPPGTREDPILSHSLLSLPPLLQYILFRRDGVILFPEFAKFGVGVYLRDVFIENSFLEKVSIGHYCLHTMVIHLDH